MIFKTHCLIIAKVLNYKKVQKYTLIHKGLKSCDPTAWLSEISKDRGLCGSGITADEKFKKQKNRNVNRYVYYKCTRTRDQDCPCGFINEEDLVLQLQELIDDLEIQTVPMKEKITAEVQRFKKFEQMLLGIKTTVSVKDIDIRNYARFILIEGTMDEKREFLRCLKTNIFLKNKSIYLN